MWRCNNETLRKSTEKTFFNSEQGEIFLSLFDDALYDDALEKKVAKYIFVDGMTLDETADAVGYCTRQIIRIRQNVIKKALVRLVNKQIHEKTVV